MDSHVRLDDGPVTRAGPVPAADDLAGGAMTSIGSTETVNQWTVERDGGARRRTAVRLLERGGRCETIASLDRRRTERATHDAIVVDALVVRPQRRLRAFAVEAESEAILDHVSFRLPRGAWFLLTGDSGAGKSTLLYALNNLSNICAGTVSKFGVPVQNWTKTHEERRGTRTGTVFQEPALFGNYSVLANVLFGFLPTTLRRNRKWCETRARHALGELGLESLCERFPGELSGGQLQRASIARATVSDPDLIILDEPLSALDDNSAALVCGLLKAHRDRGAAIIMASHKIDGCIGQCDRNLRMRRGTVEESVDCRVANDPRLRGVADVFQPMGAT